MTAFRNGGKWIAVALVVIAMTILACGSGPVAGPAPAATPIPNSEQRLYSVASIYDDALTTSAPIIKADIEAKASQTGFAYALFVVGLMVFVSTLVKEPVGCMVVIGFTLVTAVIFSIIGYNSVTDGMDEFVDQQSHQIAKVSTGDGVDRAQKAQASNFQYIAAVLNKYGVEIMPCTDPINHHADCSDVSGYYTAREINSHQVCTTTTDSDGDSTTSCHEEHDDQYVSWFPYLVRYWASPATRAKYLFAGIYDFRCLTDEGTLDACHTDADGNIDDKRAPAVFLHQDWRAPVGVDIRSEAWSPFRSFDANRYIPKLWQDLAEAKTQADAGEQASTITAYFVGKYYAWGFAANTPWATVYTGPYEQLQSLTSLPGPSGQWFNYQDPQNRTVSMNTLLYSQDGDLPTQINPVFFIGYDQGVRPELQAEFNEKARELQGAYGPQKESINYIFVVSKSIVNSMGGMDNTVAAINGLLEDEHRWGLFRKPKNQTFVVISAAEDLTTFNPQSFSVGLPFNNDLVQRDVRLAVTEDTPLTWQNLMGATSSTYIATAATSNPGQNWSQGLGYQFADMAQVGGITGILYKNALPEYEGMFAQPDPNSDDCETAAPEHVGYIRYQMCTLQYLASTIQINEDGRTLIMNNVVAQSHASVENGMLIWVMLGIVFVVFAGAVRVKAISPY